MDKIYSNIGDWYLKPVTLPNISASDHKTVAVFSGQRSNKHNDHRVEVRVRSSDTNGRNLLANALFSYDWHSMELLQSTDQNLSI
jgi:hypothetical protein